MARPARRTRAVAVTLVAWLLLLQLLLLPAPASSAAVARAIGRSSAVKQFLKEALTKKVTKSGGEYLIKKVLEQFGNRNKDQMGSAAADNAGLVVYNVSIGTTTQQTFSGVVDITSDFVWVQCPPPPAFSKVPCASQRCQSALNSTDACAGNNGDCGYVYVYGADTNTTGYLADETFTVETAPVITGRVVFGCSSASTVPLDGESGVIGFSKGNLSLVSQLNISRFSYFLVPDDSDDSSDSESVVLLGDAAVPQTRRSRSTPLLRSNAHPDLYYVKLTGIQVDGQALSGIPAGAFDLAADGGSGGVVLSSTYPMTFLQKDAYDAVRQALVSKIKSPAVNGSAALGGSFDLCYNVQSVAELTFPKLTLVFDGGDAPAMELTTVNYFYKDNVTGLQCLTMLPTPAGTPVGSVLGSLLQTGTNMIYDVDGGRLTFEKAAAPARSQVSLVIIAPLVLVWVLLF